MGARPKEVAWRAFDLVDDPIVLIRRTNQ